MDEYVPGSHGVHDLEPASVEYSPNPHLVHSKLLLLLLYDPAKQSDTRTLATELNDPAGASAHKPEGAVAYLPATQSVHAAAPKPDATKPDAHSLQPV